MENSATTIAQIFGKKDVIEIEYVIDPEGDFEITSKGKYREILVGRFKYPLENDKTSFIDLRSATLVSFIDFTYFSITKIAQYFCNLFVIQIFSL